MIAKTRTCLTTQQLQAVVAGELSMADLESAIRHVDDCEVCRQAVEALPPAPHRAVCRDVDDAIDSVCAAAIERFNAAGRPEVVSLPNDVPPVLGPYRLLGILGQGGMGTVYVARHERLRRRCAVKVLSPLRCADSGWMERFDREMTTVAALEHPNIVRASDAGQQDGWHYFVMDYLDGLDVGRIASRVKTLRVADACEIVRQAAAALQHVHAAGMVHRDVKPSNLLLGRDGVVRLLDLGLVLAGDDPLAIDERLTTVGHLLGTIVYMSPEQLLDSRDVDQSTDVHALGATLFRLISGRVPHERRGGLGAQVLAITGRSAPRLDEVVSDLPAALGDVVAAMLARDPRNRPTAADVTRQMASFCVDADLGGLVRRARQLCDEQSTALSHVRSLRPAIDPPPPRRWGRWIAAAAGGWGCAAIVAATLLMLQTESGELIIESDIDDVSIVVRRGEEVVDRLQLSREGDHRMTLKQGTYVVEIEGDVDDVRLNRSRVTITDGRSQTLRVSSGLDVPPGRLYQGKPYAYWIDLLRREQDMDAIGDAIGAVELLSRGTPHRREAASETIGLAERWGGLISGTTNPSHEYVEHLEAFYHYFPDPAIDVLTQTLRDGNRRSQLSAISVLSHYISGVIPEEVLSDQPEPNINVLKTVASGSTRQREQFDALVDALLRLDQSEDDWAGQGRFAREMIDTMLIQLLQAYPTMQEIPEVLVQRLISKVNEDQSRLMQWIAQNDGNLYEAIASPLPESGFGQIRTINTSWVKHPEAFLPAWRFHIADRLDLRPEYAAAIVGNRIGRMSDKESAQIAAEVVQEFERGAELLTPFLRDQLAMLVNLNHASGWSPGSTGDEVGFMADFVMVAVDILSRDRWTPEVTLPLLQTYRRDRDRHASTPAGDALISRLDAAIDALAKRVNRSP